jgi:hypothetical protein
MTNSTPVSQMNRIGLALAVVFAAAGCQTRSPEPVVQAPHPALQVPFTPATYTAHVRLGEGRYPDLFSAESYAIWVSPQVAALKLEDARDAGETIEPELEHAAHTIESNYVIIECFVESAFSDMSIAYDIVGFRGVTPYIETGSGLRIRPVQVDIGTPVREEARGALKAFARTNVLVFPKFSRPTGTATMPAGEPVRLVLEGYNSRFYFPWDAEPGTQAPASFSQHEQVILVRTKFSELYERLRRLGHRFD